MQGKKIWSLLLVVVLCFGMVFTSEASEIEKTKKQAEELKRQKKKAEEEKKSLSTQLDTLLTELADMEQRINEKQEEIAEKEEELYQAQADENDQYESMKKRIKYMYENGDSQFVEILLQAKSLSDFLNKTEYISTISAYDRDMLVKFQNVVKAVKEQQEILEKEQKELESMQDELIAKQENLKTLLATKSDEIKELKKEISANEEKVKQLEAAAKAAAEAARKKAEAEAAARAAQENAANGGSSSSAGSPVVSGNGMFTHPCPGYSRISSYFGHRTAPLAGASTNHKGVDFAAPTGTPIYAAAAGTVTSAGYSGKAGNLVIVNHGNGMQTYYMHCHRIYVSAGTKVSKGQNIAAVGTTGNSTGPHLHFQVMSNGAPVNPLKYL